MDTFFARNRLSAYLDGDLSDSEAAEVEAALSEDEGLRSEYEAMREAVELLRIVGPVDAPEGFHARVMARIEAEPEPGTVVSLWRRTLGRVPVEALALAAAAVIVVLVIQGRADPEPAREKAFDDVPVAASTPDVAIEPPPPAAEPPELAQQAAAPQAAPAAADGDLRTASKVEPLPVPATRAATKGSATSSAKGVSSASSAPEQPYMTSWEAQGTDKLQAAQDEQLATGGTELANGIDMQGPRSYRISMADGQILAQLSAVAERSSGRLTDGAGNTLRDLALADGGKTTWVHIVVPQEQATTVEGYLTGLGGVPTPPPTTNVLYGPEYAVFVIQVTGTK